ncbi:MAG: hypothetical protein A2Y57_00195 [Candidatus Woykebacteria bacterium RBG_13_40_7b]|uniref:Glycerol-3-phosphate acyltransferase n=1 Tax=Candidatus Woykebacteria bacterium RBG_13_40_7b TaxID=1802594 RepID=A0A1G1W622_9BACT|nr:MAG: hypothetical protein A2Y57_00195 [Candidatus Woykebacteria bacterium RBG_13_40_7b]
MKEPFMLGGGCLVSYLLGSLHGVQIVAKLLRLDLTTIGSKSWTGTNLLRAVGVRAFIMAVVVDVFKAFLPTYIAIVIWHEPWQVILVGTLSIIGHTNPIFFHFQGGKAVSATAGMFFALSIWYSVLWLAFPAALGVFLALIILTRIVSLGSMLGTLSGALVITLLSLDRSVPWEITVWVGGVVIYIWWCHRENIRRLLQGKENRFNAIRW